MLRRAVVMVALICALCMSANAKPVSKEQALQKASLFMQQRGDTHALKAVDNTARLAPAHTQAAMARSQRQAAEPYYVFDRGAVGEGFVIVAGDDAAPVDVLGYSDCGTFNYQQLPPALQEMLDGWAKQLAALSAAGADRAQLPFKAEHPKIEPMMKSKWNQGSPYNDECPMYFNEGRSVTGCVATAYAQILYYQRDKMVTEVQADIPAYDTWTSHPTYGKLHVEGIPAGSPIDWDGMTDTYSSSSSARAKKAVAQLMHYCGVAVKMDYTSSSSGAQSNEVANALCNYFGFGNNVHIVTEYDFAGEAQFDEVLYSELQAGRPFYISGQNSSVGHAFVCHGYDGAGRYYINWGWGGQSDGAFYLYDLNPYQQGIGGGGDDGFNDYRLCVLGIEPENYADRAMKFADVTARTLCTAAWDANGDGQLTYGEAAAVTDLGTVLQGKNIKSFTELHYFTGLTAIGDDAFNGCAQLTNLQLPRQVVSVGARAFKGCTKLEELILPSVLTTIGEEAFSGCKTLADITLPDGLHRVEARTFDSCGALTQMVLPASVVAIGDGAFAHCTALQTFTLNTMSPQQIALGNGVFEGAATSQATLIVLQSTRAYCEGNAQWGAFGTIKEVRELSQGEFTPLVAGQQLFLYHVGTGRYLTKGEAYGTQAVVGSSSPMRFKLTRSTSMADGVYYVTSDDTGRSGKYLFRTSTDTSVGQGVQAAFVDGTLDNGKQTHWLFTDMGNNTYTISVPQGYTGYDAACRWGVQGNHESNYAQPTWGVYSDVTYEGNEQGCQWRLVRYDEEKVANFEAATRLQMLLDMAAARHLNITAEQAVFDNLQSTTAELRQAQQSLRQRLRLINFADDQVRNACINNYDLDTDGELSIQEASKASELRESMFLNTAITQFDELKHFTSLTFIPGRTFDNCRQLTSVTLPESIEYIYYDAFRNCAKLTDIALPEFISIIGEQAFSGCTSLKTVTVLNADPQLIGLGEDVFKGVNLAEATLIVPAGSKTLYEQAPVWKDFGTVKETRARTQPRFCDWPLGEVCYIMNVGTRKYITNGEAYGTQAVVGRSGLPHEVFGSVSDYNFIFQNSKGTVFRTDVDERVGVGVKACFVDGSYDSPKSYWNVVPVNDDNTIYTLQTPEGQAGYVADEFLGTDAYHKSGAASPTNGIYWDIKYEGHERYCQWAFITEADMKAALAQDAMVDQLKTLLQRAADRDIDKAEEQAVYDDLTSTAEQMEQAVASLRRKLHYIDFASSLVRTICIDAWDEDGDGELSEEEAAAVKEIGTMFRGRTNMTSFDELRYFTGLTAIPDDAFRGSSEIISLYIPESVTQLGQYAFVGCSKLRYVAMMNAAAVVPVGASSLPKAVTLFVPQQQLEAYQTDAKWGTYTVKPYTGTPVVSASATRQYGRTAATVNIDVDGAPVNGTPVTSCAELNVATTPVGTYAITVEPGTITTKGAVFHDGSFAITPAMLTVTAKSYSRRQGEANPEFELTYKGWRNREDTSVLTVLPTATCEATPSSPAGDYEIVVAGGEAQNYEFTYVSGMLTVVGSDGIAPVSTNDSDAPLYDLQGRRVSKASRQGIYIDRQKHKVLPRFYTNGK